VVHILEDTWEPGLTESRFAGRSFVTGPAATRTDEPPSPGDWPQQAPYFRIPINNYEGFPQQISLPAFVELYERELRKDLAAHPVYYPFTVYEGQVRRRQGSYINECTPRLFDLLRIAIGEGALPPRTPQLPPGAPAVDVDREYKEAKRLTRERLAFARNPGLVRAAKAIRGTTCEACDFDFEQTYGPRGHEYIECHHVDPLGRRDDPSTTTTVLNVRMVCANCHRMVHRTRDPMAVEDLRSLLGLKPRLAIQLP